MASVNLNGSPDKSLRAAMDATTAIRKPKHGHGEGTIHERPAKDGTVKYQAQVLVSGRRLSRTFPTKPEARKWIRKTLTDADEGMLPADGGKVTVGAFLDRWLASAKPSTRPKTYEHYDWAIRVHLKAAFPRLRLRELRADHLQALYAQKIEAGLSRQSVQHLHRVMHNALSSAVNWNLVPRNVADAAKAPQPARSEQHIWNRAQVRVFRAGVAGDPLEAAFDLAVSCGLRVGEIAGLKWDDVDLDRGQIQVSRTRQRIRCAGISAAEPHSIVTDGETKTRRGARLIVLPASTLAALRRRQTFQKQERLLAGARWADSGYVFTYQIGTPLDPNELHKRFDRIVAKIGLPAIRFHDLRHTCATTLFIQGANAKQVQELLGHSQITVTMDRYSHVLPVTHQETARLMERALSG